MRINANKIPYVLLILKDIYGRENAHTDTIEKQLPVHCLQICKGADNS